MKTSCCETLSFDRAIASTGSEGSVIRRGEEEGVEREDGDEVEIESVLRDPAEKSNNLT